MAKPDYEKSAVNLCNPPAVKGLLDQLSTEQATLEALQDELNKSNKILIGKLGAQGSKILDLHKLIKEAIEKHGSYQDLEAERYAVKFARKSAIYGNLPSFKKNFPKFVELCIKEMIDVDALKGQVKGKLITEEELERTKVLTWDTGYAFYVR